jgi:hypothetical protein
LLWLALDEAPPLTREAKVDSFFFTWRLPHAGQATSVTRLALSTNSSNGSPQSGQSNS